MKQCGVGVLGQERVEAHFFLSPPPCLPVLSALVYVFGVTPLCALHKPAAC